MPEAARIAVRDIAQLRTTYGPPFPQEIPAHCRESRLLAPGRSGGRRSARAVAFGPRRRSCKTARRRPRYPDRLVGRDRARPWQIETAARRAEARREPG